MKSGRYAPFLVFFLSLVVSCKLYAQKSQYQQEADSLFKILPTLSENEEKIEMLINITDVYRRIQTDSVGHYADKALELSKKLDDDSGMANSYNMLGLSCYYISNFKKGIAYYDSAATYFKKINNLKGMAKAHINTANMLDRLGEHEEAMARYRKAFENFKKEKDKRGMAAANMSLGTEFKHLQKTDSALVYYTSAMELYESVDNKEGIAMVSVNTGLIYEDLKDYENAVLFYKKGLEIDRILGYTIGLGDDLNSLGNCYAKLGKFELALEHLKEALIFRRKVGEEYVIAETLGGIGFAQYGLGNFDKAKDFFEQSQRLSKKIGRVDLQISNYKNLGLTAKALEQYVKAETNFKSALKLSDSIRDDIKKASILTEMSKMYGSAFDFEKAFKFQKLATALNDSVYNLERLAKLNELQTKYESREKELEIARLKENELLKDIRLADSKRKQDILLYGGALSLLSLLFVGYRFRKNRKQNALLLKNQKAIQEKNHQLLQSRNKIQKANSEKEVLLKEIHHRVKNNLQLVLSLLNIQARELKNEEINEFLEKGEARIASMALIHQTLYSNDDLSSVNIKEYTENLLGSIFYSFGLDQAKYRFNIKVEKINFDIQTAVPLGLILNELACNALKHAFVKKDSGMLHITVENTDAHSYRLTFADDGVGMNGMKENTGSIGLELVSILTEQLMGTMKVVVEKGTTFIIDFKEISTAA